jgi:branched-chain amino acid transport system ATP-binding protein
VQGRRVDRLKPDQIAHAGLARVPGNIRLFGELSVPDNVRMGARRCAAVRGAATTLARNGCVVTERRVDARAEEMLGSWVWRRALPGQIPQLRRPARPAPADDRPEGPAAGRTCCLSMNPPRKLRLMKLIAFIRDKFAVGILLIEHDMKLVMSICERITVLDPARRSRLEARMKSVQSEGDRSVSRRTG